MKKKQYGYSGWQEIESSRKDILSDYKSAKDKIQNRPIQTEHGIAVEASIRKWLGEFLPSKFGVTSGYIIPEIIDDFTLYHYDIIIYDKINSPVLWINANHDNSEQGKKRAIPASYVHSVIEVKANFSKTTINEVVDKLSELNSISSSLKKTFFSCAMFIELRNSEANKFELLKEFILKPLPLNFFGGMILSSEINPEIAGILKLSKATPKPTNIDIPLVKDIDQIKYELAPDKKSLSFNEQGAGMKVFDTFKDKRSIYMVKVDPSPNKVILNFHDLSKVHMTKKYFVTQSTDKLSVTLNWSRSNFADFISILLNLLEGKNSHRNEQGITFGQAFDKFD